MTPRQERAHGAANRPADASGILVDRLGLVFDWYGRLISSRTGLLVYTYEPESELAIDDGSAIRDIASIWDLEILSEFLGRSDLRPLVDRSLEHFAGFLVRRDGALALDSIRLGEPSGIAHSAFMMLALIDSERRGRETEVAALAEGILRQQRPDGSYRIYFDGEPDDGLEFYPGEAMLALMRAYELEGDERDLTSVERGFGFHRHRMPAASVDAGLLVFYANWQSQYATLLHEHTRDEALRSAVRDYVFALHDAIETLGFYRDIERHPSRQATVEVACALEGINDAIAIATREHDDGRVLAYERDARIAIDWLLRAQRMHGCTERERGGFGHSLADRTQRIDVTGHVVGGFVKSVRNHIGV